jgi:hypothetical protein
MRWLTRALLFSIFSAAVVTNAAAQHRGVGVKGGGLPAPLPSSTAIGAGALTFGPSSTARSTQAARGFVTPHGRVVRSVCTYGFGRNCGAYPFAYWLAPYYYPNDYGNSYAAGPDYGMGPDPNVQAAVAAQNALVEQVQKLSDQVAQLQEGQQSRAQLPAPQQEVQPEARPQSPPPIPVTLILRDGQQFQVQNYAVTDHTFWDFSRQPTRKIPISSIDITASARATEAKGGEFPQLASH